MLAIVIRVGTIAYKNAARPRAYTREERIARSASSYPNARAPKLSNSPVKQKQRGRADAVEALAQTHTRTHSHTHIDTRARTRTLQHKGAHNLSCAISFQRAQHGTCPFPPTRKNAPTTSRTNKTQTKRAPCNTHTDTRPHTCAPTLLDIQPSNTHVHTLEHTHLNTHTLLEMQPSNTHTQQQTHSRETNVLSASLRIRTLRSSWATSPDML